MEERKNGLFVVYEGIDGTGKSSLISMAKDVLETQGYTLTILKEPTNETEAGKKIRESYVTGRVPFEEELQWFIDDREWNVTNNIKPALEAKHIVLVDRYFFSTACYQGVRNNNDWSSILKMNREKFPEPDLTIVIDVEPEVALERITKERVKENTFEAIENLRNVRNLFLEVVNNDPIGNYLLIDGSETLEEISDEILLNMYMLIENRNLQLKQKEEESTE